MPGVIIITVIRQFFINNFSKENIMSKQTFKVAGITVHNGNAKVRFTDDMVRRVKQFSKGGATRIDLVDLPSEMTKVEALKYLQSHAQFASAEDQATISDALTDRVKEASKGEVKVKATKATKPSLANIKARSKKTKDVTAEQILNEVGASN
jgi:hypothetical protein